MVLTVNKLGYATFIKSDLKSILYSNKNRILIQLIGPQDKIIVLKTNNSYNKAYEWFYPIAQTKQKKLIMSPIIMLCQWLLLLCQPTARLLE